jgi:hypothetical protein
VCYNIDLKRNQVVMLQVPRAHGFCHQPRPPTAGCQVESAAPSSTVTESASKGYPEAEALPYCPLIRSSVAHEISFLFFLLTLPPTHLPFNFRFCMALTATPQSALPIVPSWDETIVPTLRKRASHFSVLFSLHHSTCPLSIRSRE